MVQMAIALFRFNNTISKKIATLFYSSSSIHDPGNPRPGYTAVEKVGKSDPPSLPVFKKTHYRKNNKPDHGLAGSKRWFSECDNCWKQSCLFPKPP